MTRISILVSGGVVQSVRANESTVHVTVVDLDDLAESPISPADTKAAQDAHLQLSHNLCIS